MTITQAKADRAPDGEVAQPADFEAIYAAEASFVLRILRGMGLPGSAVEDAAQDVFVVVHRKLASFDGTSRLRTWLFGIAFRVACEYRRRAERGALLRPLREEDQLVARGPAEEVERRETARAVAEAMSSLDDLKRITLVLADMEELTVPEIAELTHSGVNTVYTRLRRARLEFNAAWQRTQRRAR